MISPDLLTGVDCQLPTPTGARIRGIGTVRHRASITGGHLVQASAMVRVVDGAATHRLPWSHYLADPGRVETVGRPAWPDLADGFIGPAPAGPALDLASINGRVMDQIQSAPPVDRGLALRTARARLRWVLSNPDEADAAGADVSMEFAANGTRERTLVLRYPTRQADAVRDFCEDLALHEWLLSTILQLLDRCRIGSGLPALAAEVLRPAVDHLLHLWMPHARREPDLSALWSCLERQLGLSRQWQASADRVRDQLAAGTFVLLTAALAEKERQ